MISAKYYFDYTCGYGPTGGVTQYMLVYTYMCLPFGVNFHEIWYIDGWVSVTDPMRPICKIGCILGNYAKKAPNLAQIGCFSA